MHSHINFEYPWFISYGHLVLLIPALLLLALAWRLKWSKLVIIPLGALALWSGSAFLIARFALDINGRATLPTEAFLPSGEGRVLDMGAGTGRSTLMVLEARPKATVVALDSFSDSYVQHFGDRQNGKQIVDQGRERLMQNLRLAGVENRATIQPGDMRQMPLEAASFDAIVSAYAIDHLNREGMQKSISEAARVLKPGGQFLLMVVYADPYLKYTFGPLLIHSRKVGSDYWPNNLRDAGFQIVEQGTRPATLYVLARKP